MWWVSVVCAGCMDDGELFGLKTRSKKCGGRIWHDIPAGAWPLTGLCCSVVFSDQWARIPGYQFGLRDQVARYYVGPPNLAWFTLSEWPCWMASPLSIPNSGISPPGFPYSFHILWHCHSDKATPRFLQTIFIFLAWLSAELSHLAMLFILLLTCTAGSMGQFKNR